MLKDHSLSEKDWEYFFQKNDWIFGYGLNYQFMGLLSTQNYVGGTNFTGGGGQIGDFILKTEGDLKYTVLVEIKKPSTNLISTKSNSRDQIKYRNGAYLLSGELLGGVSQLQVNCETWSRTSKEFTNNNELYTKNIQTVQPKGILVIGNLSQIKDDIEQSNTFELYRQNLRNPEIITFDELFERAKFIVTKPPSIEEDKEHSERSSGDSLPF